MTMTESDEISSKPPHTDTAVEAADADAYHLAQLGYKQELQRNFSQWSLISFGVTLTATWAALGGALAGGIYAGGPTGVIYGFILTLVGQCFVGATIAELASSYPTTGGMYHWAAYLSPPRLAPFFSWLTGWNTIWAYVTSVAAVSCTSGTQIIALVALAKDDYEIERWHIFLILELLNLATLFMVVFGNKLIPTVNKATMWWFLASFFICSVTVLAMAPSHRSATEVFATFTNSTGWSTTGMAFISGIINPAFAIAVLDSTTHISEEVPQPEKNVPKAIGYTLLCACLTGWFFLMAIFFSYQDLEGLLETNTGLPIAELFRQATGSSAGGFGLTFLLMTSNLCTVWNCQLTQGRIFWAMARDNGVPFSKFFSVVHPTLHVPLRAHVLTATIVALLGILYMWAATAFNAFIAANLVFFNLCYLIPVGVNMIRGRRTLIAGWFHMKRYGMLVNAVAICWIVFLIVFLEIPYFMPVDAESMNYTCVIVGAGIIFELAYFVWKRKEYQGPTLDAELAEVVQGVNVPVHGKAVPQNLDMSKELSMSKEEKSAE